MHTVHSEIILGIRVIWIPEHPVQVQGSIPLGEITPVPSEAELHRLQGELLLRQAVAKTDTRTAQPEIAAQTCFRQALQIARRQHAKSLELRAAMSLTRLWQKQGKKNAAYQLLTGCYNWFSEGFNTADLQEAKARLEQLGELCDRRYQDTGTGTRAGRE